MDGHKAIEARARVAKMAAFFARTTKLTMFGRRGQHLAKGPRESMSERSNVDVSPAGGPTSLGEATVAVDTASADLAPNGGEYIVSNL